VSIVVVGSLNMDYVLQVPSFPKRGETVFAAGYSTAPGGKGANQAVASQRLGSRVYMVGCVGTDVAGRALIKCLEEAGVDVSSVKIDSRESTGSAYITVAPDGTNIIVVNRGANFALEPSHVLDVRSRIEEANVVVVQLETPMEVVCQTLKLAREHNAVTVFNPAPMVLFEPEILTLADWLIPNETEAVSLLRLLGRWDERDEERLRDGLSYEFVMEAAGRLAEVTGAHVIVTLGDKGCVYVDPIDRCGLAFPAYEVETVDTTAAGDAFIGGMACALDEDSGSSENIAELISFSQAVAALTTTKLGAQPSLPTRIEVEEFLAERKRGDCSRC
jgi:ribokinase